MKRSQLTINGNECLLGMEQPSQAGRMRNFEIISKNFENYMPKNIISNILPNILQNKRCCRLLNPTTVRVTT